LNIDTWLITVVGPPWFDVSHDLDLSVHVRTTEQEVGHFGQTVGLHDSLELEHSGSRHVQGQRDTHRRRDDQGVLDGGESLEGVHVPTFLETRDQLRQAADSCNTTKSP